MKQCSRPAAASIVRGASSHGSGRIRDAGLGPRSRHAGVADAFPTGMRNVPAARRAAG